MISNSRYKIFMNKIYVTFIISTLNKIYESKDKSRLLKRSLDRTLNFSTNCMHGHQ
jgi:hypothetical protein